nr:probable cation-transporting ATPase 13A3 [Onthophagus taurus]
MSKKDETTKCRQIIDDHENTLEFSPYKKDRLKTTFTYFGYLITFGLLRLFYHWYPHFLLFSTHKLTNFEEAEKILVIDKYKGKHKTYYVEKIQNISTENKSPICFTLSNGLRKSETNVKCFYCKKVCYIYDDDFGKFFKLMGIDHFAEKSQLIQSNDGNNKNNELTRNSRSIIYGKNAIEVPLQSIFKLFILEALTPFYIFQVFSLIVWFAEQYYYYTIAIILMSMYGISSSIIQTRKNQHNLRGTVDKTDHVEILLNNLIVKIDSIDLVPGDILVIPKNGCTLHCDAVLLNGNCVVNESTLTGESVPVLKTRIEDSNNLYNEKEDCNHTLYSGTSIIQAVINTNLDGNDDVVKAVVIRTGFLTSKGELVKSILYPPPVDFKFERDSYKYIGILAIIAVLGFVYTIVSKSSRNLAAWDTIIKALDIITITIPPALPAALTIGKLYALNRLKAKNIFCMNSRVINISGAINCVCFDKTGTLTEDGLDLFGVIPKENIQKNVVNNPKSLHHDSDLLKAMGCCHSLTIIDEKLSGDPLDIKMFESTNFKLTQSNLIINEKSNLKNIHQNQFSSNLQRMSVITQDISTKLETVYCKGSPEMILTLSNQKSIPEMTQNVLKEYTEKGYRVLGVGMKHLNGEKEKFARNFVESQLDFIGLLIFENKLKPESAKMIGILKDADVKVVMITGDNVETAISVAKECGIIAKNSKVANVEVRNVEKDVELNLHFQENHSKDIDLPVNLTITGQNWECLKRYFPSQVQKVALQGTVFARMSSDQKQQLVLELQNLGYFVAMCGDGTNDCGALKAAHVGISLSEADASVASPFTSKTPNISCVQEVIKEGRAALVTSFGVFKFMLCYSLTEVISVIILYGIDSNLTSLQFLFIDICLVLNFASLFGYTKAYEKELATKPPCISLLSFIPLMSLIIHTILVVIFQTTSYFVIQLYDFYEPFILDTEKLNYFASFENYAVFSISLFQYIITAIVFSKGKPYRKPLISNYYLLISLVLMTVICSYMVLWPANWIINVLEMKIPPNVYPGFVILLLGLINFGVAMIFEDIVVDRFFANKIRPVLIKNKPLHLEIRDNLTCMGWIGKENVNVYIGTDTENCYYNKAFVEEKL